MATALSLKVDVWLEARSLTEAKSVRLCGKSLAAFVAALNEFGDDCEAANAETVD